MVAILETLIFGAIDVSYVGESQQQLQEAQLVVAKELSYQLQLRTNGLETLAASLGCWGPWS